MSNFIPGPVMPADFTTAVEELRALFAPDCPSEVVDDFIDLVEGLPIASKGQAGKRGARTKAVADVGIATTHYQIAPAVPGPQQTANEATPAQCP